MDDNLYSILSLDPAKSTGWAHLIISDNEIDNKGFYKFGNKYVNVVDYNIINTDTNCTEGELCVNYKNKILELVNNLKINEIVVENYFFSSKARQGAMINVYFRTMIYYLCEELGIKYQIINVSDWKRHICGFVRPTNDFIKKHGKKNVNKLMVKVSLEDKYNIKFPQKIVNEQTGKMINFRYDMIDAVAICIYKIETYNK